MGYPVADPDLLFPELLLLTLSLLELIRKTISSLFESLGLGDFLEPDISPPALPYFSGPEPQCPSAALIRELLPVLRLSDLADPPESCAVCLYEFDASDEARRLPNCRHIFHLECLDRWMDHDRRTCPLCRAGVVPDELVDGSNERIWAAAGVSDLPGESPVSSGGLL